MTDQVRLRTLLKEDELYRRWFMKIPTLTVLQREGATPWRLFVQREEDGPWSRVDLRTYNRAYAEARVRLPEVWDMAIHCRPQAFRPPIVKLGKLRSWLPVPLGHRWCVYCRRGTTFAYFTHHHNMKYDVNPEELRCRICGARAQGMKNFEAMLAWPLVAQPQTTQNARADATPTRPTDV